MQLYWSYIIIFSKYLNFISLNWNNWQNKCNFLTIFLDVLVASFIIFISIRWKMKRLMIYPSIPSIQTAKHSALHQTKVHFCYLLLYLLWLLTMFSNKYESLNHPTICCICAYSSFSGKEFSSICILVPFFVHQPRVFIKIPVMGFRVDLPSTYAEYTTLFSNG